jgi:hypothetical protein
MFKSLNPGQNKKKAPLPLLWMSYATIELTLTLEMDCDQTIGLPPVTVAVFLIAEMPHEWYICNMYACIIAIIFP